MTNISEAIKRVGTMYTDSTKQSVTSIRERKLRPSSFPYCGLKDAFKEITGGDKETVGFGLDFYGGVGTAAHTVFQKYMGALGSVVGNWKCTNKKCIQHKKLIKFSRQSICSQCQHPMEYHELIIRNRHIVGHVDGLIYLDGLYYVLDYKTTSVKNILEHRLNTVYPYAKNQHQILSYCYCLERNFNIVISGWMLQYIARDDPKQFEIVGAEFTKRSRQAEKARMYRYNHQYELANAVIEKSDVPALAELVKTKPCTSYEHWKKEFGDFDKCPLGRSGVCFNAQLKRVVWDAVQNKELRPVHDPAKPQVMTIEKHKSVKRL